MSLALLTSSSCVATTTTGVAVGVHICMFMGLVPEVAFATSMN
jgi:hypothetical protein